MLQSMKCNIKNFEKTESDDTLWMLCEHCTEPCKGANKNENYQAKHDMLNTKNFALASSCANRANCTKAHSK